MANELSPEEAVERAQRAMNDRLTSVRTLAEHRQALADVRERVIARIAKAERLAAEELAEAERSDARAFAAAISAGWTPAELRKIGFAEASHKRAPRKRQPRKSSSNEAAATPPANAATSGEEVQPHGG